jgi:hypothetical protein
MEHIRKYGELSDDLTPKGIAKTVSFRDPSKSEEADRIQKSLDSLKDKEVEVGYDKFFIQEISDRLNGPDSVEYIEELKKLNDRFRPREGRYGNQFLDPNTQIARKEKEDSIIKKFSM